MSVPYWCSRFRYATQTFMRSCVFLKLIVSRARSAYKRAEGTGVECVSRWQIGSTNIIPSNLGKKKRDRVANNIFQSICAIVSANQAPGLVHFSESNLERHVLDPHKRALRRTHYQFLVIVHWLRKSITVHAALLQGRDLRLLALLLVRGLVLLCDRDALVDARVKKSRVCACMCDWIESRGTTCVRWLSCQNWAGRDSNPTSILLWIPTYFRSVYKSCQHDC